MVCTDLCHFVFFFLQKYYLLRPTPLIFKIEIWHYNNLIPNQQQHKLSPMDPELDLVGEWKDSFYFFPDLRKLKLRLPCSVRAEVSHPLLPTITWNHDAVHLVVHDSLSGGVTRTASVRIGHMPEAPDRVILQSIERCPKREFEELFGFSYGEFEEGRCISVERDSLFSV